MPAKKKAAGTALTVVKERKPNNAAVARSAAVKRLIESYPERWTEVLADERAKLGLSAESARQSRLQVLANRMLAEGIEKDVLNEALATAGFKARL